MKEHETEFVYLASADQMERLSHVLRSLAATVRARPLRSVQDQYLDTPTQLLMRAGVACRLRRVGKRATLTLKSLTPFRDGLADRVELSEELPPGDWRWPAPLPGHDLRIRLIPLSRRLDVDCLFELRQDRRIYDVRTQDGGRLDISADRTCLAGSDRDDVLHRIEVELRDGASDMLIRFASQLRQRLKLKAASGSKFEYGLRAAGLSAPILAEGPTLRIRPRDTVRKAAARALRRHLRRMLWQVPGTRLGINPDRLHDMRVSVRRLRAILRLFRASLPAGAATKLAEELKWLGRSLGDVRDLDVHLLECSAMLQRLPESSRQAVQGCRREMTRRRDQARDAMLRDLRSPRFRALKKACQALIRRLHRPVAVGSQSVEGEGAVRMRGELRRILDAGRAIAADTPDAALHRLRVRCKRLRYACETLSDIHGKPVTRMARRLVALQDVLGAHQDAVAAQVLIERAVAESAASTPNRADVAYALGLCGAAWREEQHVRRAAFPKAWEAFDRKKTRRSFLKSMS